MSNVEQKRRELFEAWAITRKHHTNGLPFFVMKNDRGEYLDGTTSYAWEGFNAALDAVEIVLPDRDISSIGGPDSEMGPSYEQVEGCGYNYAIDDCRSAIESTNLGLKVK